MNIPVQKHKEAALRQGRVTIHVDKAVCLCRRLIPESGRWMWIIKGERVPRQHRQGCDALIQPAKRCMYTVSGSRNTVKARELTEARSNDDDICL